MYRKIIWRTIITLLITNDTKTTRQLASCVVRETIEMEKFRLNINKNMNEFQALDRRTTKAYWWLHLSKKHHGSVFYFERQKSSCDCFKNCARYHIEQSVTNIEKWINVTNSVDIKMASTIFIETDQRVPESDPQNPTTWAVSRRTRPTWTTREMSKTSRSVLVKGWRWKPSRGRRVWCRTSAAAAPAASTAAASAPSAPPASSPRSRTSNLHITPRDFLISVYLPILSSFPWFIPAELQARVFVVSWYRFSTRTWIPLTFEMLTVGATRRTTRPATAKWFARRTVACRPGLHGRRVTPRADRASSVATET